MPPQIAARMTTLATNAKRTSSISSEAGKGHSSPTCTPANSLEEKLGAHGSKVKHKRRFCRTEGCERIVKSQGLCQRHGAKPRLCKVKGCSKQAQGNFDGMCKSHFKEHKRKTTPIPKADSSSNPPQPTGSSVFYSILPASVDFFPAHAGKARMPLVAHLAEGFHGGQPPAWHRNAERKARGLLPVQNPATQLEGWERELVWMEILVLTGVPEVSFRHLARAWGRDKGFHMVLAQFICERHGDVQRKKRKRDDEPIENRESEMATKAPNRVFSSPNKPQEQQPLQKQLVKKLSVSSDEQGEAVRVDLLSSERKNQIINLLRRKSSSNRDKDKKGSSSDGSYTLSLIGADAWDDSCYGDSSYNEALAADLFNLTAQESAVLMRRLSAGRQMADDDSGDLYSRSVSSGITLGLPSRMDSKDDQKEHGRLSKDHVSSWMSNSCTQIPNTVAVKNAPEAARGDLGNRNGHSLLSRQQHRLEQRLDNGEAGQRALEEIQSKQDGMVQLSCVELTTLQYQQQQPRICESRPPSTQTHSNDSSQPESADDGSRVDGAEPKVKYNHHHGMCSPAGRGQDKQANQTQQHYVPRAAEAHQQYQDEQQGPAQNPAMQQSTSCQPLLLQSQGQEFQPQYRVQVPAASTQKQVTLQPYQPQQQVQHYQEKPKQPQVQPYERPLFQQECQPQQEHQHHHLHQEKGQEVQQYSNPGPVIAGLLQDQAASQILHKHHTMQHGEPHSMSHQHRQHSQQRLTLRGQPQTGAFQQHQSQQGHNLVALSQPLNRTSGRAGVQHFQSYHQGQHSQQEQSWDGTPPVFHGHCQPGNNTLKHGQLSSLQMPNFDRGQRTEQGHAQRAQAGVTFGRERNQYGQPKSRVLSHERTGGPSFQSMFGMQSSSVIQQQAATPCSEQFCGSDDVPQNLSNQQFQLAHGEVSPQSWHAFPAATHNKGQNRLGGRESQTLETAKIKIQEESLSQDLHDYDHQNDHLQGQEDYHMDMDPCRVHRDYAAAKEHDDHDHENGQLCAITFGGQKACSHREVRQFIRRGKDTGQRSSVHSPGYEYAGERLLSTSALVQEGREQYRFPTCDQIQEQTHNWNQGSLQDVNFDEGNAPVLYGQPSSHQFPPAPTYQRQLAQDHSHQPDLPGQAHFVELPELGGVTTYDACFGGAQQEPRTAHYRGQLQLKSRHLPQSAVLHDGSTPQTQSHVHGQHQAAPIFQQQEPIPQPRNQVQQRISAGFQGGIDQSSNGGHHVQCQLEQHHKQQGHCHEGAVAGQHHHHQPLHALHTNQTARRDGVTQAHSEGQYHPAHHQSPAETGMALLSPLENEVPPTPYVHHSQPVDDGFHQLTQKNIQDMQNLLESQPMQQHLAIQHQQAHYQGQERQYREAAQNAIKDFERGQQHIGQAEALFELPFTTPVAASFGQQADPGQQQPYNVQRQGQYNKDQFPLTGGHDFTVMDNKQPKAMKVHGHYDRTDLDL